MTTATITPGRYPDMANHVYHSGPGISKSHLDDIAPPRYSPRHYWHKRINPEREPEEKTPALILGDAIHVATLEPDLFPARFITSPTDAPRRPSSAQINAKKPSPETLAAIDYWSAFEREHAGKVVLSRDDWDTTIAVRDAIRRHPFVAPLLSRGQSEQAYYAIDPDTGALIKCKLDWDRLDIDAMVLDLKSTIDASPEGFGKSIHNYRYYVQDPWYRHVIEYSGAAPVCETFAFIAFEKEPPYAIGVYYLVQEDFDDGHAAARRDLKRILDCREANHWPDFADGRALPAQRPGWARRRAA